ncbi:hypothetical protein BH747_04465 [Enterococcus villorum]|uniref:Uncharacterized protein n=1 Tax=Enterococcus villorum TaxID=112904 RepID=A0A1V8YV71_9ENTE|nr:hypothetical protein [Enterococcus villorum]OQO70662.1 hypothetical protein BH747_04465 [Enterococcus villorum]OQO76494.1 hypothetical protein BH744_02525 [Enterococcus villorum]
MIEQDKEEFFIESTQKEKIIVSLKRSIEFYNFTSPEELTRSLQQMTLNDPTDFMLLPISYFVSNLYSEYLPSEVLETFNPSSHVSGVLIYKMNDNYKFVMIDKVRLFRQTLVGSTNIPSENLYSLCTYLYTNRVKNVCVLEEPLINYEILEKIVNHSHSDEITHIPIYMSEQKVDNCAIKAIESALKVALSNCQKNIYTLDKPEHVKWKNTLEMRKRFIHALTELKPTLAKYFYTLFNDYSKQKSIYFKIWKPNLKIPSKENTFFQEAMLGNYPKNLFQKKPQIKKRNFSKIMKDSKNSKENFEEILKMNKKKNELMR